MFRPGYFSIIIAGLLAVMLMPVSSRTLLIDGDFLLVKSFAADADDAENPPYDSYLLGTPGVFPDRSGDEPETSIAPVADDGSDFTYEPFSDYSYEPDTALYDSAKLDSIDYSLKVIAGGIILAIDCAFVWFMILKPLKKFIVF